MTDLIQEVKAALQAATPGPWQAEGREIWRRGESYTANIGGHVWIADVEHGGNKLLIANTPAWLQQLIDRVEELEEELNQERSGREPKSELGQVNP